MNDFIDKRAFSFECSICKEKADDEKDITQYIYPLSELANPEEPNENFWICKNCLAQGILDKQVMDDESDIEEYE